MTRDDEVAEARLKFETCSRETECSPGAFQKILSTFEGAVFYYNSSVKSIKSCGVTGKMF